MESSQKKEDKPQEVAAATAEVAQIEEEKQAAVSYDPFAGMTEEQKRKNMKDSLQTLINQMEPRVQTAGERRNIDKLKHLLPLYEDH